ncbi:hypothetical protein BDM02DRAFT_3125566 [Thelephora ganbajun]|uniref:Uncharacterized protein n=1 Tax=Thelephora ganbajun TaxID=370292 RepID=A0ACB6ZUW8_THEGA|nr:hypothetical protein BDM02DRAFT_3125566 [Thelephora ganbajun]
MKMSKKRKSVAFEDCQNASPRPVKLKPLREVLSKLIAQIKKKDDYAFFLQPVDPKLVPGYSDAIQQPMDFGTMTTKVSRGKYRSLEDFANDFRLVTSNAKSFNPPGSIYYTEAERIEAWGLDRITKAAATVIEYETDWNIEIDGDDHRSNAPEEEEDTPEPEATDSRAQSTSLNTQPQPLLGRRSARAAATANTAPPVTPTIKTPKSVSETLQPDGGLPGAKDGLGKKYKTKKERLRIEKSGLPLSADGSLNYWEVEDPFSLFSALVDVHRPKLILDPLHLVPFSEKSITVPSPVNISLKRNLPQAAPELTPPPTKWRHWTINRHSGRGRAKDGDEEDAHTSLPRREHATTDYGSMSVLMADLTAQATPQNIDNQPMLFDLLRNSIDGRDVSSAPDTDPTEAAALNAQDYIWSLVYGGVDGLAYIHSLAEFVGNPAPSSSSDLEGEGFPLENWVEDNIVDTVTEGRHRLVQKIVRQLATKSNEPLDPPASDIPEDIRRSLDVYPLQGDLIAALSSQIDIQNLVNRPLELAQAELEWSGVAFKRARHQRREASGTLTIDNPMSALAAPSSQDASNDTDKDDHEVLDHALEYSRQRFLQLMQSDLTKNPQAPGAEDPYMRDLRMNLLALSKRVPLQLLSVSSVML